MKLKKSILLVLALLVLYGICWLFLLRFPPENMPTEGLKCWHYAWLEEKGFESYADISYRMNDQDECEEYSTMPYFDGYSDENEKEITSISSECAEDWQKNNRQCSPLDKTVCAETDFESEIAGTRSCFWNTYTDQCQATAYCE